jgi:hypothetical protein
VSDLRIRSEPLSEDAWSQPFLPPASNGDSDDYDDGVDFAPLLAALDRALTRLFGITVTVTPGRPQPLSENATGTRADPVLAGLLATLRMGGDPARPGSAAGATLTRYATAIVAAIDAVAATAWPRASGVAQFDLEVRCQLGHGLVEAHATLVPPPRPLPPAPRPIAALRHELLALPLKVRIELAAEVRMIAGLLPIREGQVLPMMPNAEMPMIVGRHNIGRVTVTAQPDGRQHAEIVVIGVEPIGGNR